MQIKNRFLLEKGVVASLGIFDLATAQYIKKMQYDNSIANVFLLFPNLLPEDQLDFLDDQ